MFFIPISTLSVGLESLGIGKVQLSFSLFFVVCVRQGLIEPSTAHPPASTSESWDHRHGQSHLAEPHRCAIGEADEVTKLRHDKCQARMVMHRVFGDCKQGRRVLSEPVHCEREFKRLAVSGELSGFLPPGTCFTEQSHSIDHLCSVPAVF